MASRAFRGPRSAHDPLDVAAKPPFVPPALTRLEQAFARLPNGLCGPDSPVLTALARAWSHLHGGNAGHMTRSQLVGHVVSAEWNPPVLSLGVERATEGSIRTALQHWQVDVQDGTAWIADTRRVELPPKTAAADLAIKLARAILAGEQSSAVVPKTAGAIAIRPGEVPGLDVGFAETLPGRHHRFRAVLDRALENGGFTRVGPYRFVRET